MDRATKLRDEHIRVIDDEKTFRKFFTPKNAENPEIHGGFALCHFAEGPELDALLGELKVTIRCLPLPGVLPNYPIHEAGKCFLTGKPSARMAVFAKAY
ncbi:MAG: hypothetical protein QM811_03330 [Pirellulales bacterium]